MLYKIVRQMFPGMPNRMCWKILNYFGTDEYHGETISIYRTKNHTIQYFRKYDLVEIWYKERPVYSALHHNSVERFNYGKEWYDELVRIYNSILSKENGKKKALFKDL